MAGDRHSVGSLDTGPCDKPRPMGVVESAIDPDSRWYKFMVYRTVLARVPNWLADFKWLHLFLNTRALHQKAPLVHQGLGFSSTNCSIGFFTWINHGRDFSSFLIIYIYICVCLFFLNIYINLKYMLAQYLHTTVCNHVIKITPPFSQQNRILELITSHPNISWLIPGTRNIHFKMVVSVGWFQIITFQKWLEITKHPSI